MMSGRISEEALRAMDPADLLDVLATSSDPVTLTFAAEIAGDLPAEVAEPALFPLLSHPSAVVREGALIGLDSLPSDRTRARIQEMATSDPSPSIRSAASDRIREERG